MIQKKKKKKKPRQSKIYRLVYAYDSDYTYVRTSVWVYEFHHYPSASLTQFFFIFFFILNESSMCWKYNNEQQQQRPLQLPDTWQHKRKYDFNHTTLACIHCLVYEAYNAPLLVHVNCCCCRCRFRVLLVVVKCPFPILMVFK